MKLCIVDTKSANFNSVVQALKRLDLDPIISADVNELKTADKLIMPGVGSATAVMTGLRAGSCSADTASQELAQNSELIDFVLSYKKPLLGICLGMQVQATASTEVPLESDLKEVKTLGIVPGTVHRIDAFDKALNKTLVLPHMGWNTVKHNDHPLFKDIPNDTYFYFVHSFCLDVGPNTIGTCNYGQDFSAAIANDNFMGVQFHPEKSGVMGMKLLQNFISL